MTVLGDEGWYWGLLITRTKLALSHPRHSQRVLASGHRAPQHFQKPHLLRRERPTPRLSVTRTHS